MKGEIFIQLRDESASILFEFAKLASYSRPNIRKRLKCC